ncbi:MAG TPA: ABC transporter ATP-binding protein [Clostridiaceae bacterium]|nr:ABC transporter ATP-binding protein [Clostridiaceae bacterium]
MLKVKNLNTGYGNVQILYDFSCEVKPGEVVAMVGSNGSGKSTLLRAISGIIKPFSGEIEFMGDRIDRMPAHKIVARGIAHVPEGRQVFGKLSVTENLMMGAFIVKEEEEKKIRLQEMYEVFPILAERSKQAAETLSGGEQQMLAIARGLMSSPKLLLIDELSLGLAPVLVERVFEALNKIRNKVTILLVEQKVQEALEFADRGYVIQNGRLVISGTGEELLKSDIVKQAYLGL